MSGLEQIVKSIIDDNRQFREASNNRFSKLLDVMQDSTSEKFSATINEIFQEVTGSKGDTILGDDGSVESVDGSPGNAADAMGGQAAPQE